MSRPEQEKRLALAISVGVHVVVFGAFALGGLFSFLQTHSQPPPVDVTVYNEDAVPESETAGSSTSDGGSGGGGETYAAPTTPMPEVNESYTQAAQTERAVEKDMQEQHVDAATAKQVVAVAQAQESPTGASHSQQGNNNNNPAGSGNGQAIGPGTNPDAPPGNGTSDEGNGNGNGSGNSTGNGDGRRPAKKARLISQLDTASFYPESLRRKHISGNVKVHVVISPDGTVTGAFVVSSSGYGEMDEAAIRLAYQCQYEPAENEYGQPVWAERNIYIPFNFRN